MTNRSVSEIVLVAFKIHHKDRIVEKDKQVKLRIDNLFLSFGGVGALVDVSMDIRDNEILAIIGPNGAGKTALLNCINGFYKPQKGRNLLRWTKDYPDAAGQTG